MRRPAIGRNSVHFWHAPGPTQPMHVKGKLLEFTLQGTLWEQSLQLPECPTGPQAYTKREGCAHTGYFNSCIVTLFSLFSMPSTLALTRTQMAMNLRTCAARVASLHTTLPNRTTMCFC